MLHIVVWIKTYNIKTLKLQLGEKKNSNTLKCLNFWYSLIQVFSLALSYYYS